MLMVKIFNFVDTNADDVDNHYDTDDVSNYDYDVSIPTNIHEVAVVSNRSSHSLSNNGRDIDSDAANNTDTNADADDTVNIVVTRTDNF